MIKVIYSYLLLFPLITTAQTIDQTLSKDQLYQAATVASILFVCSEKYPEYKKQFRTSSFTALVASGDIEAARNVGGELLGDEEFIADVQQVLDDEDESGTVFCERMSRYVIDGK